MQFSFKYIMYEAMLRTYQLLQFKNNGHSVHNIANYRQRHVFPSKLQWSIVDQSSIGHIDYSYSLIVETIAAGKYI